MKTSRLLIYGCIGMVVGLLLENRGIILKHDVQDKANKWKRKIAQRLPHKKV